jgi:hypothetical protein
MCRQYPYKGLIIYENDDSKFNSVYYSVVNPEKKDKRGKMLHSHSMTEHGIRRIADCYSELKKYGVALGKYSLTTRNKAMRLISPSTYILMK